MRTLTNLVLGFMLVGGLLACGGGGSTEAIGQGIGAECNATDDCADNLSCLTNFAGGYCGSSGCTSNDDCPSGSICVIQGGTNYCFLTCTDKVECNEHRTVDNESNCSANIDRTDGGSEKACVPPAGSGG